MDEQIINIATLTIDKSEANRSIVDTKAAIFELQKANSELRKDITKNGDVTGEQTKKFVENEQALKKLNAQYRTQSAAINDLTLAELKENKALTETTKSRAQTIAQTKELKVIRDQLNDSTVEGAEALELINKKINENDSRLTASGSNMEKQKDNIGNYPTLVNNIGNAFGGTTQKIIGFVQGAGDVISSFTEIGTQASASISKMIGFENATVKAANAGDILATSSGAAADAAGNAAAGAESAGAASEKASGGIMSMVKAAWAFVANPIGAVITAIVVAVVLLYNVFKNFQPLIDKVEQAFAAMSAVLGILKNTVVALVTGTKSLGEAFSGLGGDMSRAAAEAAALTKAQQDLDDAMEQQEVSTLKSRAAINKLNVELKDRTKTEKERLLIANQIEVSEKQLFNTRKKIVDEEIRIAKGNLAVKAGLADSERAILDKGSRAIKDALEKRAGNVDEEVAALNSARKKAIELEDEATVNLEKTYNKRDKLQDDAAAKAEARAEKSRAAAEKAIQSSVKNFEAEIAIQRAKNAQLNQSDTERLAFINKIAAKELELVKFKLSQGLISEKEGQLARLGIVKAQSSETLALAEKTITEEIATQKKKFENQKTLSESQMIDEVNNATLLRDIQVKRINESELLESEKAAALLEIQTGFFEGLDIIEKNYEDAKKARAAIAKQETETLANVALEMKLLRLEEDGAAESEVQRATLDLQLEQKKAALDQELIDEKKTAEEVRVLKELEDKKYSVATKKIDKELAASKRAMVSGMVSDSLAAASALFGENKAVAVATALFNTYEGITAGVKLGYPAAIPAVAAAAATGFAAVRNILKTEKGSTGGGSTGGTTTTTAAAIYENPAKTQSVATVNAAPAIDVQPTQQPVLILDSLNEAQKNQLVKIKSN